MPNMGLRVPRDVIKAKCTPYLKRGKPERRTQMVNDNDFTIVATYGAQYRGLVEYYLLAGDVWRLDRLRWWPKPPCSKHWVRHEAHCYIARQTGRDKRRLSLDLMPNRNPKG
jgi:Type II intron maturase